MNSVPGPGGTGGGDAPHICLLAGEHSGDHIGAGLMAALIARTEGEVRFSGIGGGEMTAAGAGHGFASFFPMEELSIGGIFEIVPHIPRVLRRINETARNVRALGPDIVITIDSPAFAFRVGRPEASLGSGGVLLGVPAIRRLRTTAGSAATRGEQQECDLRTHRTPSGAIWCLGATPDRSTQRVRQAGC